MADISTTDNDNKTRIERPTRDDAVGGSSTRGAWLAGRWARTGSMLQRQGALLVLVFLVVFASIRYDGFLTPFNIFKFLTYNSLFGLVALGMTFVIITGGIDLSVGSVAALASVVAALVSPRGLVVTLIVTVAVGVMIGLINGWIIAWLKIPPFITTLAMLLAARGMALLLSNSASVYTDTSNDFTSLGQNYIAGVPISVIILVVAYSMGAILLRYTRFGRHVLAVGGNEDAARLMGLPVERIKLLVYAMSGGLAALAGLLLAAQSFTGIPTEGLGWELTAIASVVVGGTLLSGGMGSVLTTLVGVLLLGLIFNILDFENGHGLISITSFWQSVIRGAFLLVVVILQSRLTQRKKK
ncbi:MAG: ABC transporter permease [Ktedonobacteraceae bacterium]